MLEDSNEKELYEKFMAFNRIMLEEHDAIEIAAVMVIQGLSFYKTVMDDDDYQKIVKSIYDRRDSVHTFE